LPGNDIPLVIKPMTAPSTNKAPAIVAPVAPTNAPVVQSAPVDTKPLESKSKQEVALPNLPSAAAPTQAALQNIYSSLTNQAAQVKQIIDYMNKQQQGR
jgi:hypothetical protein